VDSVNNHLYCCTDRNLMIYDFNGNLLRYYENIHKLVVTCSVYSTSSKLLVTGSLDTEIKVWSITGGLIETFRAHTRAVTKLLLNPYNANCLFSSSLDGTVKIWSLDIMQMLYQWEYKKIQIKLFKNFHDLK
jgi:WD40 repeat protein